MNRRHSILVGALFAASSAVSLAQGTASGTPGTASGTQAAPPVATQPPAGSRPSAGKGLSDPANGARGATTPRGDALNGASGTSGIPGGVPAMSGVTPNRAELASSAFTKLDGQNRGYLTMDDVRQLDGFETAFRQSDQNRDGRLNASEFNAAWGIYSGNVR
jgi:hypothetical protein